MNDPRIIYDTAVNLGSMSEPFKQKIKSEEKQTMKGSFNEDQKN
jgi:hypothetical protein